MKEVVFSAEQRQKYKYVGRSGDHLHRMTDDSGGSSSKGGASGQGGQGGQGGAANVKTMSLDHGDVVELSHEQFKAFPDRFVPVDKKKKNEVVSTSEGFDPTDADLADTREFNQETAPVHQERRGGNLIRETDVVVDRTAGPNAFQGAGSITAEHAFAFKEEQEEKEAETERMGSVRGAHRTDPNAPRPGAGSVQASGQGPSGTGVTLPDKPQPSSSSSSKK
jgi:hypothetical protein